MAPRHPVTPYSVGTGYMGKKKAKKPRAVAITPSASRIDAKFGAATAGPNTIGGPVSASRSAAGVPFTDRAKVAEAPKKTRAAAKSSSSPAKKTTTAAAAPAAKKGLMGLLAGNKGNNERLAKERMLKASRKG